jgi:TDG/mug DNA glycosylase family protein
MTANMPSECAFDPVVDEATTVLVLGSLPGRKSLQERRYYAHPQNQFWRLIGAVIGVDLATLEYPNRLEALRAAGIGLWDVIERASRIGSLDSAIQDAEIRDLGTMIATLPKLRAVAFNGQTALRHGLKQLGAPSPLAILALPSSSAAHAVGTAAKQQAWNLIRAYVD